MTPREVAVNSKNRIQNRSGYAMAEAVVGVSVGLVVGVEVNSKDRFRNRSGNKMAEVAVGVVISDSRS